MKKVLIITYRWPPDGGIGVLRCLKFAKYLREFGWEPIVLTVKNPSYQYLDYANEKDIPKDIEIHYVPFWEPTSLFKVISGRKKKAPLQNITSNSSKKRSIVDKLGIWIRGNFFIPDARKNWIKPSVRYLDKYLESNHVDAILTDGPPHTNTVIGMRIAHKHNIPWLADFQDPWTQVDYYSQFYIGKRADKRHKALEQEVFRTANKITIASPSWKTDLESIGAKNVDVIYYGYDEDDFAGYNAQEQEEFVIFHGGLLGDDRNPETLLSCLAEIIEKKPDEGSKIKIKLAGDVDYTVVSTLEKYNLMDKTELMGMIPRKDVLKQFETASLLLLPINKADNAAGRIPGKLFEMMRTGKPILVLGPDNGDVKGIVESNQLGKSYEYDDKNGIMNFLDRAITEREFDNFDPTNNIEKFSNRALTSDIAKYLDEISQ